MSEDLQKKVNRGLAWIGAAQVIISILDLISVFVILHFWVGDTDFGIVNLAVTLFPALDIAADMGVAAAVVQREDTDHQTLSTVFWWNVLISAGLFGIVCLAGPLLGRLQGAAVVGSMFIVYGGKLLFQNVYIIPMSLMKKELRFSELQVIRVIANLVEAIVKIALAASGITIWCWVLASLSRVLITAIGVQLRRPWWPSLRFEPARAKGYLSFGAATAASQILYQIYSNLDYQVVGYFFGKAAAGVYAMAYRIVLEPVMVIAGVITEAAFPAFARLRHEPGKLVDQFTAFTRMNLVTVLPYLVLLVLLAPDIMALIGPEWVPAAGAARFLSFVGLLRALSTMAPPLLYGIGKPNLVLRYMAVATVVLPALFVLFAKLFPGLDFNSVSVAWMAGYPIAFAVLAWLTVVTIDLPLKAYWNRIWGVGASSFIAMGVGAVAVFALQGVQPLVRVLGVSAVVLVVLMLLLSRWQGINLRSIRASMGK